MTIFVLCFIVHLFLNYQGRNNILLLGDNVGDSEMLKCFDDVQTSLSIGFLNDNVRQFNLNQNRSPVLYPSLSHAACWLRNAKFYSNQHSVCPLNF